MLRAVLRTAVLQAMVLVLEESQPVASADGWVQTVTIEQIEQTPNGTRRVLQSASYNFKEGAENESEELKKKRLDVKRGARRRALESFDSEKAKAKKLKRRKQQRAPAATAAVAAAVAGVRPAVQPPALALEPAAGATLGETGPDLATQRDWALLRAWKEQTGPEAVLQCLRERGLDDEEEPWTVNRVQERHDFLCRCVRVTSQLVGESGSVRTVRSLACLCA